MSIFSFFFFLLIQSSNEADTELTTFRTNANEEVDRPLLTQQVRNGDNHEYCELDDYDRTKNPFLTEELDDNRNVKQEDALSFNIVFFFLSFFF